MHACLLLFHPVVIPDPLLTLGSGMMSNLLIVTGWLRLAHTTCGLSLLSSAGTCPGSERLLG